MENPPVITTGMPTYNCAWSLRSCLNALGKIDYPLIVPRNDVSTIRNAILSAFEKQKEYEKSATELYERLKEPREKQLKKLFEHISS